MTKPSTFSAPAILTRISYLKDKGLSLGFSTNELSDEEKVIISRYHGTFGYVLFSENQFKDEDIPKGDATDESKSPSQRLRNTLYILWKQQGSKGQFENFYRMNLEKAIDRVKALLE